MRLDDARESDNVEDVRGGPSMGRRVVRTGGAVSGGALLLVVVVSLLTGQDPTQLLGALQEDNRVEAPPPPIPHGPGRAGDGTAPSDPAKEFVSKILADTEDTWGQVFAQGGSRYEPPKLVLFDEAIDSACGFTSAAVGPFYCPGDRKVYLDLGFFRELRDGLGADGDFAQAYVVAHEIGHHVQNLLGVSDQVDRQSASARSEEKRNALSVRLELQADCLAGAWGFHAAHERNRLETGDVDEAMRAATAIGDDRLQRSAGRTVRPESFTHGTSEQRVRWFRRGLETGRIDACDTFSAKSL